MKTLITIATLLLAVVSTNAQIANISTRGRVGINQDVLIAGFILDSEATIVIRALGPTLAQYQIQDYLPDPMLTLYDENFNIIAINDDWDRLNNTATLLGAFAPADSRESAVVMTLPAGKYTAVMLGYAQCVGVGLVEVYKLPPPQQ